MEQLPSSEDGVPVQQPQRDAGSLAAGLEG